MKLPVPALFNKKEKTEYFLALLLRDEKASAIILEENEGKIHIIGKHEEYFSTSVENVSIEEMLDVLDKTISRAEETLPPNIETEKTVFGVKENWVEEKKIKKEYLAKLKKVSDELHLKPIGFLVIAEAIAYLIQEEEGAPFTGIIAEVGKKVVTLTLFRAGKSIETHAGHIEDSVPATVDALLKHFTSSDILPSRVILFNGQKDEDLAQEFISHQWSRSLPFLHVPQVAVLPGNFDARAVVFGAAEQMGFEIVGSIVDKTALEIKSLPVHGAEKTSSSKEETEELKAETTTPEDEETEKEQEESADANAIADKEEEKPFPAAGDNFGFVMEKDIADSASDEKEETDEANTEKAEPAKEEDAGFHSRRNQGEERDEEEETHDSVSEKIGRSLPIASLLAPLKGITSQLPTVFSKLPTMPSFGGRNKLFIIPPVILLVLIGLTVLYIFSLKATVTLNLQPKMIDDTEKVTFSTTGGNNFGDKVIQAKSVSTTLSGSNSGPASGKKEVGDKAKGTVTIFNSDDSKKTLSEGTVLKSTNGLEFTLDKDVTIASASGDIFSGTKSGTTNASVTASEIGTEYNLPSNTKFDVAGNSSLAAKNDSAFSGGTKKTVTVVSKSDLEKLASDLPKSLEAKAKDDLDKKLGDGEILVPDFTDTTLTKKQYSKKEGDEAKEVKLNADVAFDAVSYKKSDIDDFAQTLLKDRATSDQAIAKDTIEADVNDIKENDDTISASLTIRAGLLPKLDTNDIVTNITGKSPDEAIDYLTHLPQVKDAAIDFSPNIPFLPKFLPKSSNNITVVTQNQ